MTLRDRLAYHLAWERAYRRLRRPKTRADLAIDEEAVRRALEASPARVVEQRHDVAAFRAWLAAADYARHAPGYYEENLVEKALEHHTAARLLGLAPGGVHLDVAAQSRVAADVFERLHGVVAYTQDLEFPAGVHGREVGGDAGAMPLPDAFADTMSLHCSFEHFEGNADTRFVREAGRVLKPGGRCVIAPLYLFQVHACLTNPVLSAGAAGEGGRVAFDDGALVHASKSWRNRHGRFYSVERFVERVWRARGALEVEVVVFPNAREVDPSCYLRYAAVLRRPLAEGG